MLTPIYLKHCAKVNSTSLCVLFIVNQPKTHQDDIDLCNRYISIYVVDDVQIPTVFNLLAPELFF